MGIEKEFRGGKSCSIWALALIFFSITVTWSNDEVVKYFDKTQQTSSNEQSGAATHWYNKVQLSSNNVSLVTFHR